MKATKVDVYFAALMLFVTIKDDGWFGHLAAGLLIIVSVLYGIANLAERFDTQPAKGTAHTRGSYVPEPNALPPPPTKGQNE